MAAPIRRPPEIEAYGGGGFRIDGARVEGSILILDDIVSAWPARAASALEPIDFAPAMAASGRVEFILLGTGAQTRIAPRPVREALAQAGLGLEVMNTPEACRLYNVLADDGRRIGAALIAI